MRCSGNQPPAGQSLRVLPRDARAWNEMSGFTCSTGKSLPFGIDDAGVEQRAPRIGAEQARRCRGALPAQYMSLVWWLACIDGMTPSSAKRGMSS